MTLSVEASREEVLLHRRELQLKRQAFRQQRQIMLQSQRMKSQLFFLFCIILVVLVLIPFTVETQRMVADFESQKPEGYCWPCMDDFGLTAFTAVFFLLLENAFQTVLYPSFYDICKEKRDKEVRARRTRKAVENIYKCCYYICSSMFCWWMYKDSDVLPPLLGGQGSLYNAFRGFPYIEKPKLFSFYFTGAMGFHIGQLLQHWLTRQQRSDYVETMFVNLVACYLFGFSYISN